MAGEVKKLGGTVDALVADAWETRARAFIGTVNEALPPEILRSAMPMSIWADRNGVDTASPAASTARRVSFRWNIAELK